MTKPSRHQRILLLLICTISGVLQTAQGASLVGTWSGTWIKNGDALSVIVTFREQNGIYNGSFDSDELQRTGIPFREVRYVAPNLHFVIAGDYTDTIFDGSVDGDLIEGRFLDGPAKGTFSLSREINVVPASAMRDVSFRNGAVTLSGSLLLPKSSGPYPAILFLHGSGPESRWPQHYLAERFARVGIAALIYDKRGVGQSTGDWQKAGFEDLAADALAGIRYLQTLPEISHNKIGIFGHSQGGMLAPLVAARTPLAFVIGSAASGIDPAELEEYSICNGIGLAKLTKQDAVDARSFVHAMIDTGYRGKPRTELDVIVARFKSRPWYFAPPSPDNYYWAFIRSIELSRPQAAWRHIKSPVLLLYGTQDERVPPTKSSNAIIAMLHANGNRDVTLKMFSGADHTFSLPTINGGWPKRVSDYANIIVSWAVTKVK